jgi:hypothetical protein
MSPPRIPRYATSGYQPLHFFTRLLPSPPSKKISPTAGPTCHTLQLQCRAGSSIPGSYLTAAENRWRKFFPFQVSPLPSAAGDGRRPPPRRCRRPGGPPHRPSPEDAPLPPRLAPRAAPAPAARARGGRLCLAEPRTRGQVRGLRLGGRRGRGRGAVGGRGAEGVGGGAEPAAEGGRGDGGAGAHRRAAAEPGRRRGHRGVGGGEARARPPRATEGPTPNLTFLNPYHLDLTFLQRQPLNSLCACQTAIKVTEGSMAPQKRKSVYLPNQNKEEHVR